MVTGKSHKPSRFTRLVLYPLTGVLFFVILVFVLTLANGYRFTYSGGRISVVKTGMLIISTRPFDATITLNGKPSKQKTGFYLLPAKISGLNPGLYSAEISKKSYRTWRDTIEINPNLVTWANYIILFPEKLNISKVETPQGEVIGKSDNGRHILYSGTAAGVFGLKSMDSNNLTTKDFWPTTVSTEAWLVSPRIVRAVFSPNSDRLLLAISNGARIEYVVSDASSGTAKLIHLNATLKTDFTDAWWNVANNNEVYLSGPSGISLVGINDTTLPSPIVSGVVSFKVDESRQILYVSRNTAGTFSLSRMNLDGGNKSVIAESVVPAQSYKIGYSATNNIVTLLNNDSGDLIAYYVGNATKKYALKLSGDVRSFGWSSNGQKLYYFGKNFIKRYDWEKNKEVEVPLKEAPIDAGWFFDEYHYLVHDAKGIYEMDFDGSNVVPISESPATFFVFDLGTSNIIFANKDASGKIVYSKYIAEF